MRWASTSSGPFPKRLYFDSLRELDDECERLVEYAFQCKFGRQFEPPLSDDALEVLAGEHATVDLYAELKPGVEGETVFRPNARPTIRISTDLMTKPERRRRARTTIAHEWFHAVYHPPAWEIRWALQRARGAPEEGIGTCMQDKIILAPEDDWMEFQAGYASCAILMPRSRVLRGAETVLQHPVPQLHALIDHIANVFDVSREAAQWRVSQLGLSAQINEKVQLRLW